MTDIPALVETIADYGRSLNQAGVLRGLCSDLIIAVRQECQPKVTKRERPKFYLELDEHNLQPREPEVVPLDDPTVPDSLVPIPGKPTPASVQAQQQFLEDEAFSGRPRIKVLREGFASLIAAVRAEERATVEQRPPQRITTRCPACGSQTLIIGSSGHLVCSWLKCKQPSPAEWIEQVNATVEGLKVELAKVKQDRFELVCEVRMARGYAVTAESRLAALTDAMKALPIMTEEADYITVNPAVAFGRYNTVVMRWDHTLHEYIVFRISQPLTALAATALAHSWATATRLEIR